MPTFNQLVRKGRKVSTKKSNSPALQYTYNSLNKKTVAQSSPQKRGFVPLFVLLHLRSLTQLFVKQPEFVFQTVLR